MYNDKVNSILVEKDDATDFKEILRRRGVLDNPNAAASFIVSLGDNVALGIVRTAAALVRHDPTKAIDFAMTLAAEEAAHTQPPADPSAGKQPMSPSQSR